MKVLFLDIDGVVNNCHTRQRSRGFIGIDPLMAFIVGKITLAIPDLKVVLSSSWRHFPGGRDEVEQQVCPIYDETPTPINNPNNLRGVEIKEWLDNHPNVERYAIVDDNSDMLEEQMPNFFKTEWETGITEEIAQKIINHLLKKN